MGDPVSRPRVEKAEPGRERLQVAVRLHVSRIELKGVVVDVHDRERHFAAIDLERLELEAAHGSGDILDQDLVDGEVDLLARRQRSSDEVRLEQLARQRARGAILGQWPIPSESRVVDSRSRRC